MIKYGSYFLFCAVSYYLILPLLLNVEGLQFAAILLVLPGLIFLGSGIWGVIFKFSIVPPVAAGLLFVPATFMFMNDSALIYVLVYMLISLVSVAIGHGFNVVNKK